VTGEPMQLIFKVLQDGCISTLIRFQLINSSNFLQFISNNYYICVNTYEIPICCSILQGFSNNSIASIIIIIIIIINILNL